MDGPPPEFSTASGIATFTPCGDRRWRVAIDGAHVGELAEEPDVADAWTVEDADGVVHPRRDHWVAALADLPAPGSDS
jgi:hypothetical protein